MDLEIRPIMPAEADDFIRADNRAFGQPISDEELAAHPPIQELDRSLAAFEGGHIVGGAHALSSRMNVPGGQLPTAAVDDVSVQPTHRRRGILTQMMARQLTDIHERGEPLAALFSAESIIYGRFGYGIGTVHERWTIDRHHTAYERPHELAGRLRFVSPEEMRKTFPDVYKRATARRPGAIEPTTQRWDRIVADAVSRRDGASAYFHVAYERDGRVEGYARYRTKEPKLIIENLIPVTDDAHAALWRFCLDVDLMTSTEAWNRPTDDPLPWMLADPRRLKRSTEDGLWIRLVDVAAALSGRRYMQSDSVVLEVRDTFCPWNDGRYALEGGPGGAHCQRTKSEPDIALSAADLAAAYLGAVSFTTLSLAGRVEERRSGALLRADAMFATELKPWCPYSF